MLMRPRLVVNLDLKQHGAFSSSQDHVSVGKEARGIGSGAAEDALLLVASPAVFLISVHLPTSSSTSSSSASSLVPTHHASLKGNSGHAPLVVFEICRSSSSGFSSSLSSNVFQQQLLLEHIAKASQLFLLRS
ncbi:unnamed protein product [Lampetra planeri]